jgi:hypothetical protein
MTLTNAGNVGIGTSNPAQKIHIKGSGAYDGQVFADNSSTTGSGIFSVGVNGTSVGFFATSGSAVGDTSTDLAMLAGPGNGLRFYSNETERMRIDNSGNVLVGTTDPLIGTEPAKGSLSGISLATGFGSGVIIASRSNANALDLNRYGTDGEIAKFRKAGTTVGSISIKDTNRLSIQSTRVGLKFPADFDQVQPVDGNGDNSDGIINLGGSGNRFKDLHLSGGVYLGGTGSSNYLDDYEEGTWTPTVNSGSISSVARATYTKIGNRVYLSADFGISGTRSSTQFQIGGLPFTVITNGWSAGNIYCQVLNTLHHSMSFLPASNEASALVQVISAAGSGSTALGTDFGNGYVNVSGFYETSS